MHNESVTATKFARNVASYLDQVRYTGETLTIMRGTRPVAQLTPPAPSGLPITELANLIADAPKLGTSSSAMAEDIRTIRKSSKNKLENPWE
ncbi:MAG: type II toxin-antitoxin system Phd/YefM family antitoxin [Gammaproteobacteria bacterium]